MDLKSFTNKLGSLGDNPKAKIVELLTDEFLSKHTNCSNIAEFFGKNDLSELTVDFFKNLTSEDYENFTSKASNFSNWQELLSTASAETAKKFFSK